MDTSDKLKLLTGDLKLRAEDVNPGMWSKLVFGCIKECEPQLNYLPEQHPIKDLLNCSLSDYDRRITPVEVVTFPKDVTLDTKCFQVADLESEYVPEERSYVYGVVHTTEPGWEYITEKKLLLTCTGTLLKWVAKYQLQKVSGLGYRSHRSGIYYKAESVSFGTVTQRGLTLFKGQDRLVGQRILVTLQELIQEGIENRGRNLKPMRKTERHIAGILESIDS